MFLYLPLLLSIGCVFSSNVSFPEIVAFRDKIVNNFRIQKIYGCQTSLETCSESCSQVTLCESFFYKDDCSICQLHSVKFTDSAAGLSKVGWKYYYFPKDCEEVFQMGNTNNGVYIIYRNGSTYDVYCDMDRNGWTVFQRRMDGSTDFYRNWASYVSGFGNISHEFWLGLDKIYELTSSAQYSLRIDMEDQAGVWKYAIYSNFRLGDALAKYNLQYDTYSGTAGDALAFTKGSKFSTYDSDNDNDATKSCSTHYGGAWWYGACHHAHLNGLYGNLSFAKGLVWYQWHGHYYSLKTTEMKIRRM